MKKILKAYVGHFNDGIENNSFGYFVDTTLFLTFPDDNIVVRLTSKT